MQKKIYAISMMLMLCMTMPVMAAPEKTESMAEESITQETIQPEETAPDEPVESGTVADNETKEESSAPVQTDDIYVVTEAATEVSETSAAEETTEITQNETEEDAIQIVEDHPLDEEGRMTVETQFPDDATFPYQITLSGSDGEVDFKIDYNGQQLLIKPGTYKVKSVRDGNNKKLSKGARLVITRDTDAIYLDFNDPDADNDGFNMTSFLIANIGFLFIAGCGLIGVRKYCEYTGISNRSDDD
mgnify:FL=1